MCSTKTLSNQEFNPFHKNLQYTVRCFAISDNVIAGNEKYQTMDNFSHILII